MTAHNPDLTDTTLTLRLPGTFRLVSHVFGDILVSMVITVVGYGFL